METIGMEEFYNILTIQPHSQAGQNKKPAAERPSNGCRLLVTCRAPEKEPLPPAQQYSSTAS